MHYPIVHTSRFEAHTSCFTRACAYLLASLGLSISAVTGSVRLFSFSLVDKKLSKVSPQCITGKGG